MEAILRGGIIWHSPLTESEIAAAVGLLDPADPRTAKTIAQLVLLIEKRAVHRVLSPDSAIWRDAGLTSGVLARLQNYNKEDRRKALNDALLFFTALKHGCSVLTRNIKEFDLFQQLYEAGRVVFYERLP
jgi:predicted nucleic acid-binding protein